MKDVFSQELEAFKEVEDISFDEGNKIMAENVIVPAEKESFVEVLAIKDISDIVEWASAK